MKNRMERINIRVTPKERKLIEAKMKEVGIINMSGYIRKMAIDGYLIMLKLDDLGEISRLLGIISNNINQYARRANETGSIYLQDIQDIKASQEKVVDAFKALLIRLCSIPD